ncbi:MAG: PilZ domain-containing protein, partial [Vicinamibacteria bacterium]
MIDFSGFPRMGTGVGRRVSYTKNVSAEGLCFETDTILPSGSLLRFSLYAPDLLSVLGTDALSAPANRGDALLLLGKIVWIRAVGSNGHFEVGISLYRDLGDQPM